MADRVILTIGTKKGVFVADAAKPRSLSVFMSRSAFSIGVRVIGLTRRRRPMPVIDESWVVTGSDPETGWHRSVGGLAYRVRTYTRPR